MRDAQFLNCDLSKFRNDLPNEAIRNYIQTDKNFDIFSIFWFYVPNISKTNKVRYFNNENIKSCADYSHVTCINLDSSTERIGRELCLLDETINQFSVSLSTKMTCCMAL